jgi:hypothetical protein
MATTELEGTFERLQADGEVVHPTALSRFRRQRDPHPGDALMAERKTTTKSKLAELTSADEKRIASSSGRRWWRDSPPKDSRLTADG